MVKLFEKFGEFDSAEEINRAVAAQKSQGDIEAIKVIAIENGIDEMNVQDFIEEAWDKLCSPFEAAMGKLDVEAAALDLPASLQLWVDYIRTMANTNTDVMIGIRRKGKDLVSLLAKLIVETSKSRMYVPQDVVNAARKLDRSIPSTLPIGDITKKRLAEIIKEYYIDDPADNQEKKAKVAPVQLEEEPETLSEEPETESEGGDDE